MITTGSTDVVLAIISDSANEIFIERLQSDISTAAITSYDIYSITSSEVKDKVLSALYIEDKDHFNILMTKTDS
jgi:hypothetical protein